MADETEDEAVDEKRAEDSKVDPAPVVAAPARGPRLAVVPGFPIAEYTQRELVALARWILSDTLMRTDDELLRELRQELGFRRGGSRINAALLAAIAAARSRN